MKTINVNGHRCKIHGRFVTVIGRLDYETQRGIIQNHLPKLPKDRFYKGVELTFGGKYDYCTKPRNITTVMFTTHFKRKHFTS